MKRTFNWLLSLAVLFTVSSSWDLQAQTGAERLEAQRSACTVPACSLSPDAE